MIEPPAATRTLVAGRYRIDAWLGGGAMGDVYAATDLTTGQNVALKLMNERHQGRPDALERFRREARAARRIGHEGIVAILDFGADPDGSAYLVMELLHGESLDRALDREVRLPWPRVRSLGMELADALQAAHELGVIHRDLKPSNCFLVRDGDRVRVKILDFGLAKLFTTAYDARLELTSNGAWFGTPRYMAPEQAQDPAGVDPRADLYSLGVVLYHLLTSTAPVVGNNQLHFLNNLLHAPPRSLAEGAPDLAWPAELEAWFSRALAKRPEDRFPDARSLGAALAAIAADAVPPSAAPIVTTATGPAPIHAFDATERAPSPPRPRDVDPVTHICQQVATRSSFYVDPRSRWTPDEFLLPGGTRLLLARDDLVLADEGAILCPVGGAPDTRALVRRVCEFGGPAVSSGLRAQRSPAGEHLHEVGAGRLTASRVLFAALPDGAVGLLRLRELSARFAAQCLDFAERRAWTSLAVPALFWGALGSGRQMGIVALVEAFARALAAASCPSLRSIRLVVPDTGEAIVLAGGALTLDISAFVAAPLDRTQRFVLGRYTTMWELGAAIRAAIPPEVRPERESHGTLWNIVLAQDNRILAPALLLSEHASPASVGLKHGARLVLTKL